MNQSLDIKNDKRLIVSFHDVCFENFPDGTFTKVTLSTESARSLIASTRAQGRLWGASQKDLCAPYTKHAFDEQRQLCAVLHQMDVDIAIDDFFTDLYCLPLSVAEIGPDQDLMVVTCHYCMPERQPSGGDPLLMQVALDTVRFCLFSFRETSSFRGEVAASLPFQRG
jgi:hypothetical protein